MTSLHKTAKTRSYAPRSFPPWEDDLLHRSITPINQFQILDIASIPAIDRRNGRIILFDNGLALAAVAVVATAACFHARR